MKELLKKIIILAKKTNEISLKKKKEEENEEFEEEEEEENKDYNNLLNNNIEDDDDEDLSWDENEYDDEEITQFDKQNDVLFLRDTLNNISQKSPEDFNKINLLLGDNIQVLKEIFKKEEDCLNNTVK
jgi:predicted TIM-barrel fold metal-dependent hydrolase